jgi:hypothetical protein
MGFERGRFRGCYPGQSGHGLLRCERPLVTQADIVGFSATSDQVLLRSKVELIPCRLFRPLAQASFLASAPYADAAKQGTARSKIWLT